MAQIEIPDDFCKELAFFIENYLFQNIRDDTDIDNIEYVHVMIHIIEALKEVKKDGI